MPVVLRDVEPSVVIHLLILPQTECFLSCFHRCLLSEVESREGEHAVVASPLAKAASYEL